MGGTGAYQKWLVIVLPLSAVLLCSLGEPLVTLNSAWVSIACFIGFVGDVGIHTVLGPDTVGAVGRAGDLAAVDAVAESLDDGVSMHTYSNTNIICLPSTQARPQPCT